MKRICCVFGIAAIAASAVSYAHGDEARARHSVRKEQKEWGIAGDAKAVKRTINITMLDEMRFSPDALSVRQGETVRLRMKNTGRLLHEFVIGTQQELDEHAALMAKFPDMEHDEPYMTHVRGGEAGEIIWRFNRPGRFNFACLIAGHYQAGMTGTINVAAAGHGDQDVVQGGASALPQADASMSQGEVRKIDKERRKITLKHGEIKNLDMPGMTMVFQVKDPALLDRVKQGDKVRFRAEQVNDTLVVTTIEPAN